MSFLVEKTCWLNKSKFKSKFARGMNHFRLDCMLNKTIFISYKNASLNQEVWTHNTQFPAHQKIFLENILLSS